MKKYSVVCITQVYNELEKGNLERFVTHIKPLVDALIVYDDASTDGSYEYLLQHTPHVIRGVKNDFANERSHRQQLLSEALKQSPDFILSLDADEVLSRNAKNLLPQLCQLAIDNHCDAWSFEEINLWRSYTWKRVDSHFGTGWFPRLWRVTPGMTFGSTDSGLHQQLYPATVRMIKKNPSIKILHYGFATEKQIAYKYLTYRGHGQRGYTMLDRLISEKQLKLEPVPRTLFPQDLWINKEPQPKARPFIEALQSVEDYKPDFRRPRFSIVCLVYKSVEWLKFVHEQVLKYTDMEDKEFFFVANDATDTVKNYLHDNYIPHYVFTTTPKQKEEWYINNVYRAWNFGALQAKGDFVIFINSDMALTPQWFDNLWKAYNGSNCVASRLVESGKLRSGTYGIEKNFGTDFATYREENFQKFAASIALDQVEEGGLYMPLLIRKEHFLAVGGYPEGNVVPGSDSFAPKIAKQGEPLVSGDVVLMDKLRTRGIQHQTAFNSVVYHFQEGEMDSQSKGKKKKPQPQVAICNDLVTGTMGEKVLWDFMLESLPATVGIDKRVVGKTGDYAKKARHYLQQHYPSLPIIIQNATFISLVDPSRYTIAFLQDDLRSMGRSSMKQENVLHHAQARVTNSVYTLAAYPEYEFDIIPVGIDTELFRPLNKSMVRKEMGFSTKARIGIFVGNFSEVKGWEKIKECIDHYRDITWILVSKDRETYQAPNVRVFNRVDQATLVKLLNCADFFIIGSPVETQCLAAVEACACNIPVVMRPVGIFKQWSIEDRAKVGIFGDDFITAISQLRDHTFSPRQTILDKRLTTRDAMDKWWQLLALTFQRTEGQRLRGQVQALAPQANYLFALQYFVRYRLLRKIFGGKDVTLVDFIIFLKKYSPEPVFLTIRWLGLSLLRVQGRLIKSKR